MQNHDLGDARGLIGQLASAIAGSLNAQQALGLDLGQPSGPGAPLLSVGAASVAPSSNNAQAGGVPVASYVNGLGVRVSSVSIAVVSTSELQPSDYELVADPSLPAGSYRLTRLSDGTAQTVSDGSVVDGFRIDIAAPAPAARDRFLLQPVSPATRSIVRALDDPKGIAAAAPVTATVAAANTGTAAVASLAAVSTSINPNLTATITFTDNSGNFSYSLVDTTSALPTVNGTGSFVAGQPIALNGFELRLNGIPLARRHADRRQDGVPGRRQRQRERAARAARRDLRRRADDCPRRRRPRRQRHRRLRVGARGDRRSRPERELRRRPVGGDRERREDGGGREIRRQPRRGSGAPDPVPAELPGRGQAAAGRAVGVRHAAADRPSKERSTFMRISTANAFDNGIDILSRRQAEMTSLQDQLTTGKRISRASDDPAAAARAERARASIGRAETSQRAVEASKVLMTQTESNLGNADTLLQRARELLVSAGNASYGDSERASIANELQSLRQQLFAVANQSDGAGTYLFGGQGATQKPFIDTPTGVQYVAATGQTVTENGTGLPLTTDGELAWLQARTGNGVFVTSAAPTVLNATIDSGSVTDPSALTGADYTLAVHRRRRRHDLRGPQGRLADGGGRGALRLGAGDQRSTA